MHHCCINVLISIKKILLATNILVVVYIFGKKDL